MIVHVPREHVALLWPALEPLMRKVTVRTNGCYEPEDVKAELSRGEQTLWVVYDQTRNGIDAAMVTKFVDYPRKTILFVTYISGSRMKEWWDEWVALSERWAREHGAAQVEGCGRKGWLRKWPGAQECGTLMIKALT